MNNFHSKVRVEFFPSIKSWAFVDKREPGFRLPIDQALIDVTFERQGLVEGYVKAVHGVSEEVAKYLDAQTRATLGITATHRLGRVGTMNRVRLLPDGTTEKVS